MKKKKQIVSLFDENHKHDRNKFDVDQNKTFCLIEFKLIFAKRNSDFKKKSTKLNKSKKLTFIFSYVKNSERKK